MRTFAALAFGASLVRTRPAAAAEAAHFSYPAEKIEKIAIETVAGSVSLRAGGAVVEVDQDSAGEECALVRNIQGGALTLTARGPAKRMFALDKVCAAGFSVSAPVGLRVEIRTVSGAARVGAFGGDGSVKTGSGDIALDGPSGALDLRTGRGGISGTASSPRIVASAQNGSIELRGLTGSLDARAGDGSIRAAWSAVPSRGSAVFRTTGGAQTVLLPRGASAAVTTRSAGKIVDELPPAPRSEFRMELRSDTGAISVRYAGERP